MAAIHIGTSGWRYTPWRGGVYPKAPTASPEARKRSGDRVEACFHGQQPPDPRVHLDKDLATRPGELAAAGVRS